jgi:hypothetical protein
MTSPWPQTGAFDSTQYQAEHSPLVSFPSSIQTPDVATDFSDFLENLGPEILEGILSDIVSGLEQLFTYIIDNWESLAVDITEDIVSLFSGGVGLTIDEIVSDLEGITGISPLSGLAEDLASLLSLSTWEGFLSDAISALGGVGSDIADFVSAIEAIPQGNISGLITDLGNLLSLSAWTTFLGDVVTALGGSGSLVSDFVSAIEAIPQANISNLLTDLGNLLSVSTWDTFLSDATSALGGSGSLVADLVSAMGDVESDASGAFTWLGTTVEDILGTSVGNFPKTFPYTWSSSATSTDLTTWLGNLLPVSQFQQFIDGIVNDGTENNPISAAVETINGIADAIPGIQAISDSINSIAGTTIGGSITSIENALTAFPFENVLGTLGPANIGASVGSMLDGLWQGFTGGVTTGNSIGAVSNAAATTAATASNAQIIGQSNSTTLVNRAVTKPTFIGVDPTGDPTFPFSNLSGASLPTITVTQGSTIIGVIGTPDAGVKESLVWLGGGYTGSIPAMYVNLYSINTTTGVFTLLSQSANLITSGSPPSSSSTPAWYYYNIPSANWVTSAQGAWYAAELEVVGSGTYTLAGISHQAPPNLNAFPPAIGASRATGLPTVDTSVKYNTTSQVASGNWTHNIGSTVGTNGAIFVIANMDSSATMTLEVGSTPMTQLLVNTLSGGYMFIFVLYNPPTGTQTISWTGSSSFDAMVSVSFNNVTSTGTAVSASGSGTAASQSVTASIGQTILQALAWVAGSGTITAYNQVSLQNVVGVSGECNPIVTGYTAGTGSSVSFSCTGSVSDAWGGVAVPLIGPGSSSFTAPSTISVPSYGTSQPFLELCGSAGAVTIPPVQTEYSTAGTFTYTIPSQFRVAGYLFDIVVLGGGGGGYQSVDFGNGGGGNAGSWNATTLTYGTSFPSGTTTFSVTVGAGGTAGIEQGALPGNGGNSSVTVTTYGTLTGAGGTGNSPSSPIGASPGNETYNGTTYYGGVADTVYGQAGTPPGGGGAGGVAASNGSPGAQGAVWILAYQ